MSLRVYNTLSREKEDFQTVEPGRVKMYLCGPTVYKPAHIGHMVGPVIFDTVKRYLTYSGYDVKFVVNITDVDDKLINKAAEKGMTVEALAKQMTDDYFDNLKLMGVDTIDHFPYATQHIGDMLDIIQSLVEKGYAYPLRGDVYFRCSKDEDYGKLSHRSIEEVLAGTRAETRDDKENAADFALWKGSKEGEPAWDSPWGPGRPGWHIECSAMSRVLLGDTIDIHGGGLDLMFPHHENELAQSESCTGHTFVKYWMHNGLMQSSGQAGKVGGQHDKKGDKAGGDVSAQIAGKLAGSAGAESVKTAVFAHHHPETVRFFLLATHYRSPIDYSLERIAETGKSLEGFFRLFQLFERVTGKNFYSLPAAAKRTDSRPLVATDPAQNEFVSDLNALTERYLEAMDDDFNTGGAVGVLFEMRRVLNGFVTERKLETPAGTQADKDMLALGMGRLKELANLLGVFREPRAASKDSSNDALLDGLMQLILQIRADARKSKNFAVADLIRGKLTELKVTVEDRPDKTLWHYEA